MKKKVLWVFAVWGGLLVIGALSVGTGVWKLRSAVDTIRKDNLTKVDAQDFAGDIAWSDMLLKFAKFNPGMQMLRVIPGISWAPQSVSAGSQVVSEVHSILENGGSEILEIALSNALTPKPGFLDVSVASEIAVHADDVAARLPRLQEAIESLRNLQISVISDERVDELVAQCTDYVKLTESALAAMKVLPQLTGSEGPMTYFIGITNEAELRGIQGIIGEYAIVQINDGQIFVSRTGSNTDLVDPKSLANELQGEYADAFGISNTEWQNVNLSPFMDSAAAQITHAWKVQTGQTVDGVILLDTIALAKWAIPKLGSVESAQGRLLNTWESLSDYLSNGIYFEFPNDQKARKQFQSELARRLIESITSSSLEPSLLIQNLAKPLVEGRVVVWLNGNLGDQFNRTFLARSVNGFPRDFLVAMNNLTGNKMDFYLDVTVHGDGCSALGITLENTASTDIEYPEYLARRLDAGGVANTPIGSFLQVDVDLPPGRDVVAVRVGGVEAPFDVYAFNGIRTIVRTWAEVLASKTASIELRFTSKNTCQPAVIRVAPLRNDVP